MVLISQSGLNESIKSDDPESCSSHSYLVLYGVNEAIARSRPQMARLRHTFVPVKEDWHV